MFTRKLMINLVVFVVCGAIALTIPVFVNYWQTDTASAGDETKPPYVLQSTFVGDNYPMTDARIMWQIYLTQGETVIATWEEIYNSVSTNNNVLSYDTEHLILTPNGLCYRGLATTTDYENLYATGYSSTVTYQGFTCHITLA